jgi:hypothetical protein
MFAALLALTVVGSPVAAAPLRYQLSGDAEFSFVLDDHPTPDRYVNGSEIDFYSVPGAFGALAQADVYMFTLSSGGGIVFNDFDGGTGVFLDAIGPQLFAGSTMTPSLLAGQFDLIGVSGGRYHLSVSSVPEVRSWIFMALGFGALGHGMRRRSIGLANEAA